ncbi:purine/pyrimidine permease [Haloarcula sp. S1AR25-5A]|uniref:Purine/pyrimidine permease n=1 Tax=Haloarcula terrestris TaxID=2950533 RepID=A0AAE4EVR5_9EURY|nr:solute carrier family 23 protein [Haloarcula terrestris]MDS0221055.1 purine/pyrimidine permease [Haloarcula terrestris]
MTDETPPDDGQNTTTPEEPTTAGFVEYGIDDKPPRKQAILLGVQHYLTMIGASVAIPLGLAGAMGMLEAAPDQVGRLIGTFFVVSGIATLAQTTLGNRYPIVQGGTFSMLAPGLAIIGVLAQQGADWQTMLVELQGAVIVAGIVEMVIGYSGLMGKLKRYVGPVVIAPVIALIGLALFNVPQIANPNMGDPGTGQNWWLLGLTMLSIVACSQYLDRRHRAFKLFPVLLGILFAWSVAAILSITGVFAAGSVSYVSLGSVTNAPLVQPVYPFQWGLPQFTPGFIVGMFAGMLASVIESFGDYHSVARIAGRGAPNGRRINHGIGMEGIGNVFAGVMGTGNGCTSYTENVGAIAITGVASRYVVQIGAVVMILVGYFGPAGQLFATIPSPIIGGLYIVMFGQIAAVGLSQLKYVDLDANRNVFIVGFALFAGLAVPEYMSQVGQGMDVGGSTALQQGLAAVPVLGGVLGTDVVSTTLFVMGGTGMVVGGIVAFVLDNTVPGTREERGLAAWAALTEDDSEYVSAIDRIRGRGGDRPPAVSDD